MRSTFGPLNWL